MKMIFWLFRFIEPDEGRETYDVTQKDIVDAVDIQSAAKVR